MCNSPSCLETEVDLGAKGERSQAEVPSLRTPGLLCTACLHCSAVPTSSVAAGVPPPAAAAAAPPQPAPAPPPKPTGPPADVRTDTVDTSSVAAEAKPVVATLVQLFSTVAAAAPPVKKREMDDTNKRLGVLLWKLNAAQVAPVVVGHLQQLASLIDRGELQAAWQIQVQLTASDWDECGTWLTALKRLLKAAMQMQH